MLTTRHEEIEARLIRVTDELATAALYPMTRPAAREALRHHARRVIELTELLEPVDGTHGAATEGVAATEGCA